MTEPSIIEFLVGFILGGLLMALAAALTPKAHEWPRSTTPNGRSTEEPPYTLGPHYCPGHRTTEEGPNVKVRFAPPVPMPIVPLDFEAEEGPSE